MGTNTKAVGDAGPPETRMGRRAATRVAGIVGGPWGIVAAVAAIVVAMGWQFTDPTRSVPALDAAWYQWRAEYVLVNDPAGLITLRGVDGALAGGYRVAEPVLAALFRTVGGVGPGTPTVILSVLFRVLAAVGIAAFAWQQRRDRLLLYLTLLVGPPLFLLQRFFGFLDNFFALALMAGVLLLLGPMGTDWTARICVVGFLYLGGLTHPTTLALFLLPFGALAAYRVLRERSIRPALRSEGPILAAGAVAVLLTVATWVGGLWGPTAGLGEAAMPPPQPASYFVQRSISVLSNLTPIALGPLLLVGGWHLAVSVARRKEWFADITLAWTLPLVGMLGFLLGAAYPYFRFFNATLAPILVAAVGLAVVIRAPRLLASRSRAVFSGLVAVAVLLLLGSWWIRGLSLWNSSASWLTPEVREQMAAARAYLDATPEVAVVLVIDAQPDPAIVPYGEYKEYTNSAYALLDPAQVPEVKVFFGRVEDLAAGRPTRLGEEGYDRLAQATAAEALPVADIAQVLVPEAMNTYSTNPDYLAGCPPADCVEIGDSGLHLLPGVGAPLKERAARLAEEAAGRARAFSTDPPGPLSNLPGVLAALIRLGLLLVLPGLLLVRRLPGVSWVEGLVLVPLLSAAAVTTVGVAALTMTGGPLSPAVGWISWGIAVVAGLAVWVARGRSDREQQSRGSRSESAGSPR